MAFINEDTDHREEPSDPEKRHSKAKLATEKRSSENDQKTWRRSFWRSDEFKLLIYQKKYK